MVMSNDIGLSLHTFVVRSVHITYIVQIQNDELILGFFFLAMVFWCTKRKQTMNICNAAQKLKGVESW